MTVPETYHPTPPPEGWCNELFLGEPPATESHVAPIYRWYYCRLPKGHEDPNHSCFAFRLGR